jgi:tRNA dimethylallyltransferase
VLRALEVWEQSGRPALGLAARVERSRARRTSAAHRGARARHARARPAHRGAHARDARPRLGRGGAAHPRRRRPGRNGAPGLGYAEALALAEGHLDRRECERRIALATRQFARRQRTWLRKFPEIAWFRPQSKDPAELLDGVLENFGW